MLALAQYLHLDAAVFGSIDRQNGQFEISLRVTPATKAGSVAGESSAIAKEDVMLAASDETSKLAETFLARETDSTTFDKTYPGSGRGGHSFPRCVYCPSAEYSESARKEKFQGTVTLEAVVDENGRASDVRVLRRMPGGLTDKAIESVQQWRFQPATDSAGNPVAVRQVIEVTFHLY